MRNRFVRTSSILHYTGALLQFLGVIMLSPLILVAVYWDNGFNDNWGCVLAFLLPALGSFALGCGLYRVFRCEQLDTTGGMLLCALGWLAASAVGALPFVIGVGAGYLDACFEAMSGFTTTGITVFKGLGAMPRSIIFWRALTQWLGGIGILSFFLAITFRGSGAHHIFGAESHKISASRPAPGLYHTLQILWGIYAGFTLLCTLLFWAEGMSFFDSTCHSFTALSTGGFSPHDQSLEFYRINAARFPHWRLIEYTAILAMMLGGINFLVHYRVLTGDVKALWDNIEIRYWWALLAGFVVLIMFGTCLQCPEYWSTGGTSLLARVEENFRVTSFQVVSILTTTGFATRDIGAPCFPPLARQLFLVMMVIGGCVGSTGGGIKVQRVAILARSVLRELFKLRVSKKASSDLVVDGRVVPESEIDRVAALFFAWVALLVIGGGITALCTTELGAMESASGMFSALCNIGPCYISVTQMIEMPALVKVTYIVGMLAGRLEILPVLLLFSRRAWA